MRHLTVSEMPFKALARQRREAAKLFTKGVPQAETSPPRSGTSHRRCPRPWWARWSAVDHDGLYRRHRCRPARAGPLPARDADMRCVQDRLGDRRALDYAYQRYLLHRDVKPANILLTDPRAGERRILLADFGIARAANDSNVVAHRRTTVMVLAAIEVATV